MHKCDRCWIAYYIKSRFIACIVNSPLYRLLLEWSSDFVLREELNTSFSNLPIWLSRRWEHDADFELRSESKKSWEQQLVIRLRHEIDRHLWFKLTSM